MKKIFDFSSKKKTLFQRATLLAVLVIVALTTLFFSEVIFKDRQFSHRDDSYFYMPLFEYVQQYWNRGELPLWDPTENLGQPLMASATASVFYPIKVVYFLPLVIPISYYTCFKIYTLFHVLMAALTMLGLMRYWRFSVTAALIASLGYTFAGTIFYQYCNTIYLVGAAWFPLAILCGDRLLRQPSMGRLITLSTIFALVIFGGEPQSVYLTGLLLVGLALVYYGISRILVRRIGWLVSSAVLAAAFSAIQILPTAELTKHSDRTLYDMPESVWDVPPLSIWEIPGYAVKWLRYPSDQIPEKIAKNRPASMTTGILNGLFCRTLNEQGHQRYTYSYSMPPWQWIELLWSHVGGRVEGEYCRWFSRFPCDNTWFASVYMGVIPLVLALISFRLMVRKKGTGLPSDRQRVPRSMLAVWLSWTVLLAFLASLGGLGPYWFYRAFMGANDLTIGNGDPVGSVAWLMNVLLPGYVSFRYPAKIGFVVTFGLAILAGIGWDSLRRKRKLHRLIKSFIIISILTVLFVAVSGQALFEENKALKVINYGPYFPYKAWLIVLRCVLHGVAVLFLFDLLVCRKWNFIGRTEREHCLRGGHTRIVCQMAVILLLACDLYFANAVDVLTVPTEIHTAKSPVAAAIHLSHESQQKKNKEEIQQAVSLPSPRYIRFSWYPLFFGHTSSPTRYQQFVHWDRLSLAQKYHCNQGVQNILAEGTMWNDEYSFFAGWAGQHGMNGADIIPVLAFLGCNYWILPQKHVLNDDSELADGLKKSTSLIEMIQSYQGSTNFSEQELVDELGVPCDVSLWRIKLPIDRIKIFHQEPNLDKPLWTILDQVDSGRMNDRLESEFARFIKYEANCIELAIKLTKPGDVVVTEQYFPGWKGTLFPLHESGKGTPVEIHKTLGFLRRVSLDEGEYRLVMEYHPFSLYLGATISLVAWILAAAVLLMNRWQFFSRPQSESAHAAPTC